MGTRYIPIAAGEYLRVGDQVYYADEQPETEVEKLAREIYVHNETYSAKDSFRYAEEFIAERDRRRREFGK
jgi:hypothetical protein